MIFQYATIEETIYFWVASNDTSGSGDDGDSSGAALDIRLGGAAANAAPVLSLAGTLLSHANFPAGCWEFSVPVTSGNGFSANNTYSAFTSVAVDSQNPTGFIGAFSLKPIIANATQIEGADPSNTIRDALLDDATRFSGADIATLVSRLTATRAGYLDNLSAGAVALEATLTAMKGGGWSTETLVTIEAAINALNDLSAAQVNTEVDIALTDYSGPTKAQMDAGHALLATAADISRLLGLSHENTYHHTRVYSGGKLTSAKIDLYNSKANAQTHDGTTGIVAKYTVTATYSGSELATMNIVRDS
jgi:hypothetical protein